MTPELEALEARFKAFVHHVEVALGIVHDNVTNVKEAGVSAALTPIPPTPAAVQSGLSSDNALEPVELTPGAAFTNGQIVNQNTHYFAWLRSLTAEQLAAWCVNFLTLDQAAVDPAAPSFAVVTVGGVQYKVNDTAQGIILTLANQSGATFPIS